MRVVADEFEIFEGKIVDVFDDGIQFHPRQRSAIAGKLLACLVQMVVMEVEIAKGVDEIARRKIDNLRSPSVRRAARDPK